MFIQRLTTSAALICLSLVAAGCGAAPSTSSSPTAAQVPTGAPSAAASLASPATSPGAVAPASSPAAPTRPAASPMAAASAVTSPSPVAGPAVAAPAGGSRLTIDPNASSASYHAREQLAGNTIQTDAIGTTKVVSGSITLTGDGAVVADQSQIAVDLSQLQSNESRRDNFIKGNTLQTGQFPQAVFVPRQAPGLPAPLPRAGEAQFQLVGDLTVHGVTKPAQWQVTARFDPADVIGTATTTVNISDFGMTPPKVGPVLGIEDSLVLDVAFTAHRQT